MQNLALKYRPRKFEEIAGQRAVSALLKAMFIKDTMPNVLLLEGSKGSGKTTTARIVAAALNCESMNKPCGECESCTAVFEGNSLAVREIDASSHGLVDDIRQLQESLMYSVGGSKAVLIIDECQGLSKAASNALLKTLEFPPENTVFILITTESNKILPTVRSRCMSFVFRRINIEDIYNRLLLVKTKENLKLDDSVVYQIALKSKGSLRDSLLLMDQLSRAGVSNIQQYSIIFGNTSIGPSLISTMLTGRHSQVFLEVDKAVEQIGTVNDVLETIIESFRDIIVLKGGGSVVAQNEDLSQLAKLASEIDTKKAVAALRALWDARIKLRGHEQSPAMLYLVVAAIIDALSIPVFEENSSLLTFAEMESMINESA